MKAVVAAFNQEKALVGAFSVITKLRMDLFEALPRSCSPVAGAGLGALHAVQLRDELRELGGPVDEREVEDVRRGEGDGVLAAPGQRQLAAVQDQVAGGHRGRPVLSLRAAAERN